MGWKCRHSSTSVWKKGGRKGATFLHTAVAVAVVEGGTTTHAPLCARKQPDTAFGNSIHFHALCVHT